MFRFTQSAGDSLHRVGFRIAMAAVVVGMINVAAVSQAADPDGKTDPVKSNNAKSATSKSDSKAAIEPFLGRFESEKVKLVSRGEGEKIRGEIVLGDQVVDFTATVDSEKMTGLFSVGGVVSQFTAVLQGDVLTFTSGLQVFKLKKIKSTLSAKNLELREKVLTTNGDCIEASIIVTPDNGRFAFVEASGGKRRVVVDGVTGQPYLNIGYLAFSQGGSHISYVGDEKGKWRVVIDDQQSQLFDAIDNKLVTFSDNGKRYAYAVRIKDHWHMVVDGKVGMPYDSCGGISFSSDGKRFAFAFRRADKWYPMIDGKEGKPVDAMGPVAFNVDGSRYAFAAVRGINQFVVIDGVPSQPFEAVKTIKFSDDGKHIAFVGVRSFKEYAVIDGQVSEGFASIDWLEFSPDSQRFAYRAHQDGQYHIVVDGKIVASHDEVGPPIFSPDSQRVSYWAKEKTKRFVIFDGKSGKSYDQIGQQTYGPNGRRVGYVAKLDSKWVVVIDGKQSELFDSVRLPGVVFSSDGSHFAFVGTRNGKEYIVVDQAEAAVPGDLLPGSQIVFTGPNTLRTLIRRGDSFIRLDIDIAE